MQALKEELFPIVGSREVHRDWERIHFKQVVEEKVYENIPQVPGSVRFVCISDTHGKMDQAFQNIPYGDVLIHAGDFSEIGLPSEVLKFNEQLACLPHPTKIVIAGNHDVSFDTDNYEHLAKRFGHDRVPPHEHDSRQIKSTLTNCIYLEDSETQVQGIRIYGSPWQPEFCDWAFNLPRGKACKDVWDKIPEGIDVLVTHGPPLGHGDKCFGGHRAGCYDLLRAVERIRPRYHVFGHIHEGSGVSSDGQTDFINASTCDFNYRPNNQAIVFDIKVP